MRTKQEYQEALDELYEDATNGEDITIKEKFKSAIDFNKGRLQELIDNLKENE